jgi:hypothetical protein
VKTTGDFFCTGNPETLGTTRLEPAAFCVTGRRSNQLNYAAAWKVNSPVITAYSSGCPSIPKTS